MSEACAVVCRDCGAGPLRPERGEITLCDRCFWRRYVADLARDDPVMARDMWRLFGPPGDEEGEDNGH